MVAEKNLRQLDALADDAFLRFDWHLAHCKRCQQDTPCSRERELRRRYEAAEERVRDAQVAA